MKNSTVKRAAKAASAIGLSIGLAFGANAAFAEEKTDKPFVSQPDELLFDYDVETLIPILQELGLAWEGRTAPGGAKVLLSQAESGIKFVLAPSACVRDADDGCYGVNMIAVFAGEADRRVVQAFNYRYPYTSAGIDNGGSAFISRYDIADYGMPKGNFARSLEVFLSQAAYFQDTLRNTRNQANQVSFTGDLAANSLNLQTILADDTLVERTGVNPGSHEVSLEQTAELIGILFEAGEQAPEKILNDVAR